MGTPADNTMRAAVFDSASRELTVTERPIPEPGPDEVRVRVRACGICLSDVHLIDGTLPTPLAQVTPGHEAAGVIDAVGSAVPGWQPGERVILAGGKPCSECVRCIRGALDECLDFRIMGFRYDGAWAEYVVVPHQALTNVPEGVPFEQAAILADAVSTPYAGLVHRAELRPGESIGLWGIGGLGAHAVMIARMVSATPIIAVDPHPAARERALAFGADVALDPGSGDIVGEVFRRTDGLGLDVAVDLVGANAVLAQGANCLGRHGRLVMIGLSAEPIQLGPGVLFGVMSRSLLGHLGYAKRDLDQLADLVAAGRLDLSRSVSATMPLDDVVDGVRQLATKEGDPIRLVVTP